MKKLADKALKYVIVLIMIVSVVPQMAKANNDVYNFKMSIQNSKGVDIQQDMYGLLFEDINYSADGGLYAEMVENRSFEAVIHDSSNTGSNYTRRAPLYHWSAGDGSTITATNSAETGLNGNNTTYLNLNGKSFKNKAFRELGMPIVAGEKYTVSLYARSDSYTGAVKVRSERDGKIGFIGTVTDSVTSNWKKYEVELTAENTVRHCDLIVELASPGEVSFDMISVMPGNAVRGFFRKDLVEKMKDLNPSFLRFPGGCIVEGWDLENAYRWKDTVGPVETRKQNWNLWATTPGTEDQNQTYGLGYYEFFVLAEYLECEAIPVQNVGMACQFRGGKKGGYVPVFEADGVTYTDEFYEYVQDTLDLIEFANGEASTKWGKLRADMGHPEPFNLGKIVLGNEQWEMGGNQWFDRYTAFEKAIHKSCPDIELIGSSGPYPSGDEFISAWDWFKKNKAENDRFTYLIDEHYYNTPDWFLENDHRYDPGNYDRGTKVLVGEYSSKDWTLINALSEAAYMTGMERNADVVYMASLAPAFAKHWPVGMICFLDNEIYLSANYWVQHMYMNNMGDYTLTSSVDVYKDKAFQTVSYDEDTKDLIVKLVNPYEYDQRSRITIDPEIHLTGEAEVISLTGKSLTDENSFESPDKISPKKSSITVNNDMDYKIPAKTFVVMRIHTSRQTKTR